MKFLVKCVTCTKPETPWEFRSYEDRSIWTGKHRVTTGHSVKMWEEPNA